MAFGCVVGAVGIGTLTHSELTGLRGDLRAVTQVQRADTAELQKLAKRQATSAEELARVDTQTRVLTDANRTAGQRTPEAVAAKALKSVYTVETDVATGSSFVWRAGPSSLLITNAHVLEGTSVGQEVSLHQGKKDYTATVLEVNTAVDLAVLQATVPGDALVPGKAPTQGSTVVAIGAPFGLDGTVTTGALSAVRERTLQFSAPISPGNSGGALVDLSGHVIGVTSAKIVSSGAEGLGIAIPVGRICGALRLACGG